MEKHLISKSSFIRGLQCTKSFYLNKYHKELQDEITAAQAAVFSQGHKVGELAQQQLFPGGVDCSIGDNFDYEQAVKQTQDEIAKGATVLYEAAFLFNGVYAALDILIKDNTGWKAYEVKSSTSISEVYEYDAAIQYYTITNSGIDLKDISIAYINNQYIKNGALDIKQLFVIRSVKDRVLELLPGIPDKIAELKKVLTQKDIPNKDIGPHCNLPYKCSFKSYCWKQKQISEYSVFNISRLRENKKFELYENGIVKFKDIPKDFKLNERQWIQVNSELNNKSHIDKAKIRAFVKKLKYPLSFFDVETFATAIPLLEKESRPYQPLVFQYSLHILPSKDKPMLHKEFLAEVDRTDPREKFISQLIEDCGEAGNILVYNIAFEKSKLQDLAELSPEFKSQINDIIDRLVDLMLPFQQGWYYTPAMQGSYSIKKVLPALVPSLSYKNLKIQEGSTASNMFAAMITGEFTGDVAQARKDLLAYCKLDTLAMVEILKVLESI